MTASPPAVPTYTLGNIEAAAVSFLGAFAGALLVVGADLTHAAEIGALAAALSLGYNAYQTS
jgi:hypothetical protein